MTITKEFALHTKDQVQQKEGMSLLKLLSNEYREVGDSVRPADHQTKPNLHWHEGVADLCLAKKIIGEYIITHKIKANGHQDQIF